VPWLAGQGRLLPAFRELRERAALLGDRLAPAGLARDLLLPALPIAARRMLRRVRPRRVATELDVRHQVWGQHSATVADALREAADRLEEARTPHAYSAELLAGGTLAARCESWTAAGGRMGVSYRHPLLDRRLLELALAAPPECFRSGGWDRACFRMALEPFLPVEVAWNPRKAQAAVTALSLERLTVAAGRGTHARNVELAELESLRREADLSTFALVRQEGAEVGLPR
jgi:asparagine synthase (glutamine-hydrolysing)